MARESQIQIHRTEAAGATPSGLTSGELAVNLRDQKLFVGLSSGGYLTFNSVLGTSIVSVAAGNGINVVGETEAGVPWISPPSTTYIVTLNPDITGHTLNITGNAIFSGSDSGVTFNGRVSIGNGSGAWGLYRNPDEYNLTPSSAVLGTFDFTKTIAASIDYANRVGGKVAELVPANAFNEGNKNVIDIDSITGAGMFLAKSYSVEQGGIIGTYLGTFGSVPPLFYKNAPGDPPQTNTVGNVERALLVENINTNFQALGLVSNKIGTPFRTLIQYGTWIDNIQSPSGYGGAPSASGSYETTFDKYVRTGYLLRGGTGASGGATGTYVWSQWKNLVETVDDLGKYGVSTVNGGTGDISITGAGNDAAVVVRSSVAGTNRIDARIATTTGLTGVASFHPGHFTVTNGNVVASFASGVTFNGVSVFSSGLSATGITANSVFTNKLTATNASFSGGVTFTGVSVFSSGLSATGITANSVFANSIVGTNASFASGVTFSGTVSGAVKSVNGNDGVVTITGSSNNAAIIVRSTVAGTHLIDARMASLTVTGVASFDPRHFALGASGHVSLTGSYQVTGDTVVAGNSISVSRSNNQATITNAGVTGITSGTVTYGNIGTNGIFLSGTTGNISIQNTGVRSLSVQGSGVTADWYQKGPRIEGDGYNINVVGSYDNIPAGSGPYLRISSSGLYSLNGLTSGSSVNGPFFTITGDSGAIRAVNDSNTASIIFVPRIATSSLTGVASFDPRHFAIGASGHVSFTGSYQVTGDTVVAGNSISVVRSNNQVTVANTGVTGIGFGANDTGLTGKMTLTGAGGAGGSLFVTVSGKTVTLDNRVATSSLTGVASFPSPFFTVSLTGAVNLATGYSVTGDTVVAGNSISVVRSNNQTTIANTGVTGIGFGANDTGLTGKITLTGSAITVAGNTITFTSGSGGVPSVNGDATAITITGAGSDAAVVVRSSVAGTHVIDARLATNAGVTGVASFNSADFNVTQFGAVSLANGIVIGIKGSDNTTDNLSLGGSLNLTASPSGAIRTTVTSFGTGNINAEVFFDARVATSSLTGVASFPSPHFTVSSGAVSLANAYTVTGDTVVAGNSISVVRSFNQVTVANTGVTGIGFGANDTGLTGKMTLTGAGGAGGSQFVTVSGKTVTLDNRVATSSLTGVASFYPGHFTVSNGNVVASFSSGVTFNGTVSGAVKSFNGNGGVVTITGAGQGNGQAIKVTSTVAGTHLIDARLASTSLTGVAAFDSADFTVDSEGYVHIINNCAPNQCTDCASLSNDEDACRNCTNCLFELQCDPLNGCVPICRSNNLSILDGSGFGVTGVSGGSGSALYFDPANLTAYTSNYTSKKTNYVLIYDGDETGLVKAKRASLENFFSENAGLVTSATTGQLTNAVKKEPGGLGTNSIELAVVLGNVAAGQEGLVKGASAFAYIETNTVRSFNGLTGSVTAVASVNGCTAAVVITGSASEIEVLNTCPNIVIGLPDNVTISNLNVLSGATFSGNISAKNIVTSVNGATGPITNVAKTDTANAFTALNTFNAGLSASGATFANDIRVNGVNIGLGSGNVASNLGIGKGALSGNSGGLFNTAIGSGAMEIGTNSYSVAFGYNALNSCTGGGLNNVALGSGTMTTIGSASSNVAIGSNSSHSLNDGNYNISIGADALVSNTNGSSNIAIGNQALYTNGYDLNASNNIAIGYQALYTNDEGQENTAIGNEALRSIATTGSAERNTAIGYQAGRWRGTGTSVISNRLNSANDSIFIGWRARSSADAQTNQIVIGNNTLGGGSNTTTIGTTASTDATIYGKLHGTNGVSGPTASFNSLTVSQNTTLGSTASNTTTIYGAKIVNESIYSNGTLRNVGINFANGQVQTLTGIGTGATGTTAIYFMGAPATGAGNVTLLVTNGGSMTGNTTTWEGRIKWPGGVKPTLSTTGFDVVSFITPDAGTTIYGFLGGLNFS